MVQMDNSFSNKNTEDGSSSSWESLATSKIVTGIDSVRTKTTGPAIHISRTVVYGLTMFLIGLISIPFLVIGTSRGVIEIFDNWVFTSRNTTVWFVYLLSGIVWCSIGLFIWNKRPKGAATPKQKPIDFESKNA